MLSEVEACIEVGDIIEERKKENETALLWRGE